YPLEDKARKFCRLVARAVQGERDHTAADDKEDFDTQPAAGGDRLEQGRQSQVRVGIAVMGECDAEGGEPPKGIDHRKAVRRCRGLGLDDAAHRRQARPQTPREAIFRSTATLAGNIGCARVHSPEMIGNGAKEVVMVALGEAAHRMPAGTLCGRPGGWMEGQNSKRTPNCTCRGSPVPLCTVPSKLKTRLVTSGRLKFALLNTLKTSTIGCTVSFPNARSLVSRRSTELNWLSLRPWLRRVTEPSGLIRSCGVLATAPLAVSDCGCAER